MAKIETSEKAYIVISDLTNIEIANQVLRDIVPEINPFINVDEYIKVIRLTQGWIDSIREGIEVIGEDDV